MKVFAPVVVAAILALSQSLFAQWPAVKTPNVPRNQDGSVNMTAPAPRTPDGHVDISGVWAAGGGGGRGRGRGAGGAAGEAPAADTPPIAQFFNVGAGMPDKLAPMTPWALELRKQRQKDNAKDNPDAHCLPIGHMQLHLHPQPRKYLWTPGEIVMIWEANYGLRHIYLDGRQHPTDDAQPYWYGYTTGKWEGDTLVATTTHLRDGMWLDVDGTPLTDQGKITERFRRPNFGSLEIDVTIEDPKAFTRPFTVRVNQRIMVDTELIEFICNENELSSRHFN